MNKTLNIIAATLLLTTTAAFAQSGGHGAHFIESWDLDGDGAVSAAEITQKRLDIFASFDADEDGNLSATEYALFDEARANDHAQMGSGHGKNSMGMDKPMERDFNDTNADGQVSAEEFATGSTSMFSRMDRNGDGSITTDDFGH